MKSWNSYERESCRESRNETGGRDGSTLQRIRTDKARTWPISFVLNCGLNECFAFYRHRLIYVREMPPSFHTLLAGSSSVLFSLRPTDEILKCPLRSSSHLSRILKLRRISGIRWNRETGNSRQASRNTVKKRLCEDKGNNGKTSKKKKRFSLVIAYKGSLSLGDN